MSYENINYAWLAGFFDGEGCITSQSVFIKGKYISYPRVHLQITITQKDRTPLDMIQKEFGGTVHGKVHPKFECFHIRITGKQGMKRFLHAIYPYSVCKKEQIELALQFIETMREENLGCVGLSSDIHDQRKDIHDNLRKLKNKGKVCNGPSLP